MKARVTVLEFSDFLSVLFVYPTTCSLYDLVKKCHWPFINILRNITSKLWSNYFLGLLKEPRGKCGDVPYPSPF